MSDEISQSEIVAALARLEAGQAKLEASQEAMEARLMARMNDANEKLIERLRGVETSVALLAELGRSTNTLLSSIANVSVDLGRRVTDLEKKGRCYQTNAHKGDMKHMDLAKGICERHASEGHPMPRVDIVKTATRNGIIIQKTSDWYWRATSPPY